MRRLTVLAFLLLSVAAARPSEAVVGAPPHDCIPATSGDYGVGPPSPAPYTYTTVYVAPKYPSGYTNPSCGDASRGKLLYGNDNPPPLGRNFRCNECHGIASPLEDTNKRGGVPVLMVGAPRNLQYIADKLPFAPGAGSTWLLMTLAGCGTGNPAIHCLEDREPGNVMGDLGDIAEYLYACNLGIAPCVAGGGGGGSPGQLSGSGPLAFGSQGVGTTSATRTLTLSNVGGATVTVASVTSSNPAEFPITGNTCTVLTQATACDVTVAFRPSAAGTRGATITVTSDGLYSPQSFDATGTGVAGGANHTGIWWNANEPGWGVNFQHDGDVVFATWFTYDAAGKPWWLVMTAYLQLDGSYTGTLYKTTGSWYGAPEFVAGKPVEAGTGTIAFADAGHATLSWNVTGMGAGSRAITPQAFGPLPTCRYGAPADLAGARNYQGLWWNADEPGWGINFAHQGDTIFATWFTFDTLGAPTWLVSIMTKGTGEKFDGDVYSVTATPFGVLPFVANLPGTNEGKATLTFANGNSAAFAYTIGVAAGNRQLTRQPLGVATAGTVCSQ